MEAVLLASASLTSVGLVVAQAADPITAAGKVAQLGATGILALALIVVTYAYWSEHKRHIKESADRENEHRDFVQKLQDQANKYSETLQVVIAESSRLHAENSLRLTEVAQLLREAKG